MSVLNQFKNRGFIIKYVIIIAPIIIVNNPGRSKFNDSGNMYDVRGSFHGLMASYIVKEF